MLMSDVINVINIVPHWRAWSGAVRVSNCTITKRHSKNIQHIGIAGEIERTMFQFFSWIYKKKAVKEYECFICGSKTEFLHNHQRRLARVHQKHEDGTAADQAYCDKFANKRSKKWQMQAAAAKAGTYESCDVEPDTSLVAKVPKVKMLCRIKKVDETELMEVGNAHTIALPQKIGMADISCTSSVSDAMEVMGGHDQKFPPSVAGISQDKLPTHSATLTLPATGIDENAFDNIAMLLNDVELHSREDELAVHAHASTLGLQIDPTGF